MSATPIRNVSDTAGWVAAYRAEEPAPASDSNHRQEQRRDADPLLHADRAHHPQERSGPQVWPLTRQDDRCFQRKRTPDLLDEMALVSWASADTLVAGIGRQAVDCDRFQWRRAAGQGPGQGA